MSSSALVPLAAMPSCDGCGTELAPRLLACPACGALLHRERLTELAAEATAASARGDHESAAASWRAALALLPEGTTQRETVALQLESATRALTAAQTAEAKKGPAADSFWGKLLAPLGAFGLLLWKLKVVLVALLTKGKLLLLGLTKMGTVLTMLASFGLYWTAWGWTYAAAIIASIYVHEMGHVAALRRRGLPAAAPLFVPGVGAFVRMHEHARTPREDADVGLAGPIWGLATGAVAIGLYLGLRTPFWLAIVHTIGWITLFNLTPVWQLDGSRGFHALSRLQRTLVVGLCGAAWLATREGLLVLIALAAAWRAFEKQPRRQNDWRVFATYSAILLVAAALTLTRKMH